MAQMSPQQEAANNHAMRAALIASGVRCRKKLGVFTAATSGTSLRVKLFNVGIITKLLLDVSVPVTIGTANAVASLKGPWNYLNRIRLTDYDGTDRVNLSGFELYILNCRRYRSIYGSNNEAGTSVLVNPDYPITTGNKTVRFLIEVPIAYDPDNPIIELADLRGAIMAQTAVGEMYLNIDTLGTLLAGTNGDVDALFAGTTGSTTVVDNGGPSITVFQDYILPQTPPGAKAPPLPFMDLSTVYEIVGNVKSSDNLAVNTPKILSYPNARSVIGAYYNYVTGGTAALGNMSTIQLVANGNNILEDETERSKLFKQRKFFNSDLPAGAWIMDHRDHPIETALFGNIQAYLTPAVVTGGNQYIEYAYESFFLKGQALPGFNQAS